jgi:hypothetical protein
MKKLSYRIFLTFLLILSINILLTKVSYSQVTQVWEARWRDFTADYNNASLGIAIDKWQNIYVAGYTQSPHNNFVVIKYNTNGTQLWVNKYYGTNDSTVFPMAMGIDSSGNVFVAGYINYSMSSDNVITVKFNSADGNILWAKTYKAPNNWGSGINALAIDKFGNSYLVGGTTGKYSLIIKYNPQGDTLWTRLNYFNASYLNDCTVDDSCNIYATGLNDAPNPVGSHSFTLKYSSDGILRWAKSYTDSSSINFRIAVDGFGNCYSGGGIRHTGGGNLVIFKYDINGNLQWLTKYIMPIYREAQPNKLCVNKAGTYIVSGGAGTFTTRDCLTIGINAITGDTIWTRIFDGTGHDYDEINDVVLDKYNNAYVTGYSIGTNSGEDYLTMKYSPTGQQLGLIKYNYANGLDIAKGIVIDTNLNVYVTGGSWNGIVYYIATLKYSNFVSVNISTYQCPVQYQLYQNYPNPFNPTTTIEYELQNKSYAVLTIYDILGKKIEDLVNAVMEPGRYNVKFDASKYSSGIYFYSLSADNTFIDTKKMIILK